MRLGQDALLKLYYSTTLLLSYWGLLKLLYCFGVVVGCACQYLEIYFRVGPDHDVLLRQYLHLCTSKASKSRDLLARRA